MLAAQLVSSADLDVLSGFGIPLTLLLVTLGIARVQACGEQPALKQLLAHHGGWTPGLLQQLLMGAACAAIAAMQMATTLRQLENMGDKVKKDEYIPIWVASCLMSVALTPLFWFGGLSLYWRLKSWDVCACRCIIRFGDAVEEYANAKDDMFGFGKFETTAAAEGTRLAAAPENPPLASGSRPFADAFAAASAIVAGLNAIFAVAVSAIFLCLLVWVAWVASPSSDDGAVQSGSDGLRAVYVGIFGMAALSLLVFVSRVGETRGTPRATGCCHQAAS